MQFSVSCFVDDSSSEQGRRVASSRWLIPGGLCVVLMLACGATAFSQATLSPQRATVCQGQTVNFLLSGIPEKNGPEVTWEDQGTADKGRFANPSGAANTYTPPSVTNTTIITITAKAPAQSPLTAALIVEPKPCPAHFGGEMLRTVVSFEQIGAAGTDSAQKWAFDLFVSRPVPGFGFLSKLSKHEDASFGPRFRWWGNVGLGSYPQQVNTDILTFASDFAGNAGKIPVNQLVQTAQFFTGPELRLTQTAASHRTISDSSYQKFSLNLFAGIGAIGPFSPGENATVFQVPAPKTPQYSLLCQQFPETFCPGGSVPASAPASNVAFVSQTNSRFGRQFQYGGLRLYTIYTQPSSDGELLSTPPATVEFSVGHSDLVTRARHGLVGFASAYYPFPLGSRTGSDTVILYLFGEADLAITHPKSPANSVPTNPNQPIFLAPAKDAAGNPVPLTDPNVLIITVPSNQRDTYRIGAGLDLLTLFNKLKK